MSRKKQLIGAEKSTFKEQFQAEPTLKDKILSFFKGASKDYESVPNLSNAARRYYKTYKKLFDGFAVRNQGNNALSIALEGTDVKKMPVTDTKPDSVHVTGDNDEETPGATSTDVDTDTRFALSKGKAEKLKNDLVKLGTLGIRLDAGGKSIRILTDKFTQNKNIFSNKGRNMREVNARIKAIPHFAEILRSCTYESSDTEIHGLENDAKKGVVAMHRFKGTYDGFDIEVVVRDKGSKQFLYEIKFIEKEKSPQQSMTDESASPAPLGDAENKPIITHSEKKSNTPGEKSAKKSSSKRFALDTDSYSYEALTKKSDLYVIALDADIPRTKDGKIDNKAVIARGKLNAKKQNNPNNTDTDTYVRVDDIGLDVLLGAKGLQHGLARSEETALAVMKIGDIIRGSVAVNELNGNASRKTDMSYVLLGACHDSDSLYVVRSVVSKLQNDVTEIDVYQLSAVKGKKTETPNSALKRGAAVTEQSSLISSESPVISIADFLQAVKEIPLINEIFSEDVAAKLGVTRSEGST